MARRRLQGSYKADKEKVVLIKFCEDYLGLWSGVIVENLLAATRKRAKLNTPFRERSHAEPLPELIAS